MPEKLNNTTRKLPYKLYRKLENGATSGKPVVPVLALVQVLLASTYWHGTCLEIFGKVNGLQSNYYSE